MKNREGAARSATLFRVAARPIAVSAVIGAVELAAMRVPAEWRGPAYEALWFVLITFGVLAPVLTTIGGWVFLRRGLHTRTAVILVPYLMLVGIGLAGVYFAVVTGADD